MWFKNPQFYFLFSQYDYRNHLTLLLSCFHVYHHNCKLLDFLLNLFPNCDDLIMSVNNYEQYHFLFHDYFPICYY